MVQAEVADRLAAPPGSRTYGVPSVKAAWFADVRRAGAVGRTSSGRRPTSTPGWSPWTRREPPPRTATREQVFAVVDAAFAQRRKALRGALRELAGSAEAAERRAGARPASTRWPAASRCDVEQFAADRRRPWPRDRRRRRAPSPSARPPRSTCCLGVGPRRADGFHPLATVYQAVSLYDDLTVHRRRRPDRRRCRRRAVHRRRPTCRPTATTSSTARPRGCSRAHHGLDRGAAVRDRQGHPGRRRAGRRLGRRRPRAGRARPAVGPAAPRDDDLLALAAELGSDVPFALLGGTALGDRARRGGRRRSIDRGAVVVGGRAVRRGAVDAGGLPPTSTSCGPTRRPAPATRRRAAGRAARAATRRRLGGGAAQRPASRPRCDLRPDLGRADRRAASTPAPCADCCPAPGRPACSSASPRDHARAVAGDAGPLGR